MLVDAKERAETNPEAVDDLEAGTTTAGLAFTAGGFAGFARTFTMALGSKTRLHARSILDILCGVFQIWWSMICQISVPF